MWTIKEGPDVIPISRELVEVVAGMKGCPDDRPLSRHRAAKILQAIENGRFRSPEWGVAHCLETQEDYRVNGKHSSFVLNEMGTLPDISVVMTIYECPTLKDMADLYATFDPKFSSRNNGDIYQVYASTLPELAAVKGNMIRLATVGMGYAKWEENVRREAVEDRANLLVDNPDFVLWMSSLINGNKELKKSLSRGPVVAAMFHTYQRNKEEADKFWLEVREGSNPDKDAPSRTIQRYLMNTVIGRSSARGMATASDHEMMVCCIHAWNAHRGSKTTVLRYYADKPTPRVSA